MAIIKRKINPSIAGDNIKLPLLIIKIYFIFRITKRAIPLRESSISGELMKQPVVFK